MKTTKLLLTDFDFLDNFAGTPPTITFAGTSLVTTAPAQ